MLLSQPPSRQAFYHRKSPPPLGVGPRAPDETVTLQQCLSPPHAADHVADRCSPLIVAIGRSLGSRECSLAELRFRVGRKKILDGTLGGEWWLESLSAPRAAGAGVQSAAIQGAGEKAALAGTHSESLPHFCRRSRLSLSSGTDGGAGWRVCPRCSGAVPGTYLPTLRAQGAGPGNLR